MQMNSDLSSTENFASSSSKKVYRAIAVFAFFSILLILVGGGKLLNLAFPVGAFAIGVFSYYRAPLVYVGFTWWLWFLTPLVRRISDYRSGFTEPSPVLLTPILVTLVSVITLQKYLSKLRINDVLPFILCLSGVLYGFLIGLIYRDPQAVILDSLDWLSPILFSFHLFLNWRSYPNYRQNIQRVFVWGVLIMGIYGVIQYLVAPPWDGLWLENAGMVSIGEPVPLGIRVWSTLNSPRPFGSVMAAGLLLLLTSEAKIRLLANVAGYLSLLLSLSRAAWGSWIVGLIILWSSLKSKFQIRLILTIGTIALCLVPLLVIEPFSETVATRFDTLSDLEEDGSAQARSKTYNKLLGRALSSIFGQGLGGFSYDSGILSMLFDFGWFGITFYLGGLILLLLTLAQCPWCKFDPILGAARAIIVSLIAQLPIGSPMSGSQGMVLWGFIGIAMAAVKYHQNRINLYKSG